MRITFSPLSFAVLILLCLLSGFGSAQTLPDAPSTTASNYPSVEVMIRPPAPSAPPAGKGPWLDRHIADATYATSTVALVATTVINVEMTARCAQAHTCLTQIDPGASRGKLYAYTLPTDFVLSFLAYELKGRSRLWWVPQTLFTGANLFSAGRSYARIQQFGK